MQSYCISILDFEKLFSKNPSNFFLKKDVDILVHYENLTKG
jgi:hypothetical protein